MCADVEFGQERNLRCYRVEGDEFGWISDLLTVEQIILKVK